MKKQYRKQRMNYSFIIAFVFIGIATVSCRKKNDDPTGNANGFIHTSGTDILDANE